MTVYQLFQLLNITLYSSIIVNANPFENVEAEKQKELFESEGNFFFLDMTKECTFFIVLRA